MSDAKWSVPANAVPVAGAPGYFVTRDGDVWSATTNWRGLGARRLAPYPDEWGYPFVRLAVSGRRKIKRVHRLVAEAFLPPKPFSGAHIRHLDGNPAHCAADNLAWGTAKDNAGDRERHGRTRNQFTNGTADREAHRRACAESWRARHE